MAFEIMKEILEAEQRAEEILKQASVERETMRTEAVQKSNAILSEAKKEAKKASQQKIEKAIADSQPIKAEILAQAAEHCQQIQTDAQSRLETAVQAVVGKVVG